MRHRIAGKQLCRDSEHRRAMLRNLAAGLFEHGQIETTLPKAKAVQPFAEKCITIARRGGLTARRRLESMLTDRKIHAWVADPNVGDEHKDNPFFDLPDADRIKFNRYGDVKKAPRLIQHVMTRVAPLFEGREGGYTRIIKLGKRRLGDGTELVLLQLVGREDGPQLPGTHSPRREKKARREAFLEKLREAGTVTEKIGGDDDEENEAAEAEAATAVAEPEPDEVEANDAAAPESDEEKPG